MKFSRRYTFLIKPRCQYRGARNQQDRYRPHPAIGGSGPSAHLVLQPPRTCESRRLRQRPRLTARLPRATYGVLMESCGRDQPRLAPKEQPPRKLSGKRDRAKTALWKAAAALASHRRGRPLFALSPSGLHERKFRAKSLRFRDRGGTGPRKRSALTSRVHDERASIHTPFRRRAAADAFERAAPRAGREARSLRGLRDAAAICGGNCQRAQSRARRRRAVRRVAHGPGAARGARISRRRRRPSRRWRRPIS